VSTEVLTVVPVPDAAVTRTRFPAATRVSETPPPVTPVELLTGTTVRTGTRRRWLWLASGAAALVAALIVLAVRLTSSDGAVKAVNQAARAPVPAHPVVTAQGAAVTPPRAAAAADEPRPAAPLSAEVAPLDAPPSVQLGSSKSGTAPAAVGKARPNASAARRKARVGPSADVGRAAPVASTALPATKKKPPESALPGSGL
jgi:hypothetical protein